MAALSTAAVSLLAVALSGCNREDTNPPSADATSISYIKVIGAAADGPGTNVTSLNEYLAKVPDCNFVGTEGSPDLWKSVDIKCCQKNTWTEAGIQEGDSAAVGGVTLTEWDKAGKEGDDTEYSCPVGNLGNLNGFDSWVRGFIGCNGDKKVVYAESCEPEGLGDFGWPMSEAVAQTHWEAGTYESCHCHAPSQVGDRCFVGQAFPGMAFFGLMLGDAFCAEQAKAEVV